ncbi:MAG: adenosylcobalamin-dependent ribonucleoside-diphosphate reductase [Methanomassiliicoccales archaeon]
MKAPSLSRNAIRILRNRYLLKDDRGEVVETPAQMFWRVARNVASVDPRKGRAEEFYEAMAGLEFLPNSPTLMNAGTEIQQLSACFVIPVVDSIEGIYDAVKHSAMIHQSGGGTGFSFSSLRPSGDVVRSTGGVASGPVSFMRVFDSATEAVKQGGRRRGASMGILRVDHPDIREFVHAKEDLASLTNFNISVAATDEFMEKSSRGEEMDLINPRTGGRTGSVDASELMGEIAEMAWRTGDPGMIFIDEVNRRNPAPALGRIDATNPCGEVPLLPFEACNLGSINLALLAEGDGFDWDRFEYLIDLGITFLDDVIDASRFPIPRTEEVVSGNRKVGLGVMGLADCLIELGLPYGSEGSLSFARELVGFMRERAEEATRRLGEERGDFPNIDRSVYDPPRRNLTVLSVAPTGTISMIAGCSSGIEPLYAITTTKHVMEGEHLREVNPLFERECQERGLYSEELMSKVEERHSIQGLEEIPEDLRELFVTAHDVAPRDQVMMQAAFQERVDNAVSKTINLPHVAGVDQVDSVYRLAHRLGCKGITVYREGSKPGQVLTVNERVECPICGNHIQAEEGAFVCRSCGHSI